MVRARAHARTIVPISGEPGEGGSQELLEHAAGELIEEPAGEADSQRPAGFRAAGETTMRAAG